MILDSGNVLVRPVNGRWFPPPSFVEVLAAREVRWATDRLEDALAIAGAYLDEVHSVPLVDEDGERLVWLRYYELLLEAVGVRGEHAALAAAIHEAWAATVPVEPYPWSLPVLRELHGRGIPVVVLSDAWPSLRRFYRELDLAPFVTGMVISAEEGRTKPDPLVYAKALALLGVPAADAVFVDDWPGHVRAATDLGLRALRLCHEGGERVPDVEEITDLRELLALL